MSSTGCCACWSLMILLLARGRLGRALFADPVVALRLELVRELRAAGLHDASVDENMDEVRLDVVQDALIVRDEEDAQVRAGERVHALRHDAERVDVEPRVGL